jgi:hypothetical protein
MEKAMKVSQDTHMARIEQVLPTIGWIDDAAQEQKDRAMLTVWAQTAPAKHVRHVINVISTTRFSD